MAMMHPQFDPVAVHLGPLSVRWYGLMYLVGFVLFLALGHYRIKKNPDSGWTAKDLDDLLFYGVLGVILGGRLGYVLFYKFGDYMANPLSILKVWEGGMSFHGGFLGVLVAVALFARNRGKDFWAVTDFIAPLVPLGLAAGRMGNFINGELWGRPADPDAPWAMIFPQAGDLVARHPSQLYQFALEGMLLFFILWFYSANPRRRTGQVSAVFLIGYGAFRFIAEFAREPDNFLGLLALNLSMGQWLSLPMILIGVFLLRRPEPKGNHYRRR